jgi:hypothetical protein
VRRNDDNGRHQHAIHLEKWCAIRAKVNVEFGRVVMHNVAEYKVYNNIYKCIIVYE